MVISLEIKLFTCNFRSHINRTLVFKLLFHFDKIWLLTGPQLGGVQWGLSPFKQWGLSHFKHFRTISTIRGQVTNRVNSTLTSPYKILYPLQKSDKLQRSSLASVTATHISPV